MVSAFDVGTRAIIEGRPSFAANGAVIDIFDHLNGSDQLLGDVADDDTPATVAQRRVLGRLGEYVAQVIRPLNIRPRAAELLFQSSERIEVRVSSTGDHILLVIAPDGDLSAEVFMLRTLAARNLPLPRLLGHDLSRSRVPFSYALESYVGGASLDWLEDGPLMRIAARQVGRTLRRAHQVAAPGFGRPTTTGRWPTLDWPATLEAWLAQYETFARAEQLLGQATAARLYRLTLEHPALADVSPQVLHGAVEPARAIVTVGEGVQLEALTRPGDLVGGDPMFDLAYGLLPRRSELFRQGLMEGYTASGVLNGEQQFRLERLRLLLWAADVVLHGSAQEVVRLSHTITGIEE